MFDFVVIDFTLLYIMHVDQRQVYELYLRTYRSDCKWTAARVLSLCISYNGHELFNCSPRRGESTWCCGYCCWSDFKRTNLNKSNDVESGYDAEVLDDGSSGGANGTGIGENFGAFKDKRQSSSDAHAAKIPFVRQMRCLYRRRQLFGRVRAQRTG